MTSWQDPHDPERDVPEQDDEERSPFERPPFERDPEAQHAPGAGEGDAETPPPMHAGAATENVLDAEGIAREPVGNDNIREGRVGGVMGPAHQSMGQGQGG